MPPKGRTLTVYLAADTANADRELDGFAGTLSRSLVPGLAAGAAAAGVLAVKLGVDAVNAASDFNETLSKSNVVFGDAAEQVQAFAATAETSLGLSKQAALDASTTFGVLGKSAGLSGTELAGFSTEMAQLAADMGSFNNASIDDTIAAIGSGLRGEAEPLRAFGVLLDDATLKQQAMADGIYNGTGSLTQQQKVLAAHNAILKQTTDQTGDFARTSDGLANQTKILEAAAANASVTIGTQLLKSVEAVNKAMGGAEGMSAVVDDAADTTAAFTRGVGELVAYMAQLVGKTDKSENALATWTGHVLDGAEKLFPFIVNLRDASDQILAVGEAAIATDAYLAESRRTVNLVASAYNNMAYQARQAAAAQAGAALRTEQQGIVQGVADKYNAMAAAAKAAGYEAKKTTETLTGGGGGGGGGMASASDEVSAAMTRATESTQRHIDKLDALVGKLDKAKAAQKDYADSIASALSTGVDVKQYFQDWQEAVAAGKDVGTLAAYLNTQLAANVDWAKQLATVPGLDPSSPGAQALIQQMAGLGAASGPEFMKAFGTSSYAELATALTAQQNAATGTGALFATYFYGAGTASAIKLVEGMADQIEKDEKRLRKIGHNMGEKIGEGIKSAITEALNAAMASVSAASHSAGAASASARTPVTVTVQAGVVLDPVSAARTINRILADGAIRTGRGG